MVDSENWLFPWRCHDRAPRVAGLVWTTSMTKLETWKTRGGDSWSKSTRRTPMSPNLQSGDWRRPHHCKSQVSKQWCSTPHSPIQCQPSHVPFQPSRTVTKIHRITHSPHHDHDDLRFSLLFRNITHWCLTHVGWCSHKFSDILSLHTEMFFYKPCNYMTHNFP